MFEYIKSDYTRYFGGGGNNWRIIVTALLGRNHCFSFSFWLRLCKKKNIYYPIARLMHRKYKNKYGLQIPIQTQIGYGLYIGHGIGIVINPTAIIGNNVNLSQFLTIGSNEGKSATIGDNVYIGPSVCIVEDVNIGSNVTIGAGAVITKDIPNNATAVGVPAKVLNYDNPGRYIKNRYER
jgi:serine O-acetyltransferase